MSFEYCLLCKCAVTYWREHIKSLEHQKRAKEFLDSKKKVSGNAQTIP